MTAYNIGPDETYTTINALWAGEVMVGNDVVTFLEGTHLWAGDFTTGGENGTAGNLIEIRGEPGKTVILQTNTTRIFRLAAVQYLWIHDLTFDGSEHAGNYLWENIGDGMIGCIFEDITFINGQTGANIEFFESGAINVSDITMRRITMIGNDGGGIAIKEDWSGIFEDINITQCENAFSFGGSGGDGVSLVRGKFYSNNGNGLAYGADSDKDDIMSYSLIYDNGWQGVNISAGGLELYNITTYRNSTLRDEVEIPVIGLTRYIGELSQFYGQTIPVGGGNHKVQNCIFVNDDETAANTDRYLVNMTSFSEFDTLDYNCYWGVSEDDAEFLIFDENGGDPMTWSEYQTRAALAGHEVNSIYADPQFRSPSNNDFRLLIDSPCYNIAIDIIGVTNQGDINGNPFHGSVPDMGAYNVVKPKSYELSSTQWTRITFPGDSGTCWKKTGGTVVIDHTDAEGDSILSLSNLNVTKGKSKRVPLDQDSNVVLSIPADSATDVFYALALNDDDSNILAVGAV